MFETVELYREENDQNLQLLSQSKKRISIVVDVWVN